MDTGIFKVVGNELEQVDSRYKIEFVDFSNQRIEEIDEHGDFIYQAELGFKTLEAALVRAQEIYEVGKRECIRIYEHVGGHEDDVLDYYDYEELVLDKVA